MIRALTTLAVVAVLAYIAICALLYAFQRSLIYFPQPRATGSSAATFNLKVSDADLVVTTRKMAGVNAIIYFGGNAEDVSYNLPSFAQAFPAHAIYLLHYRGYGGSTGKPTEAALQSDALALFDMVSKQHSNIVIVGRSLGSGVAIQVAGRRPAYHLVLVTPYDSIQELASQQFPYFPVKWLLTDKFESGKHASKISTPTLLIAAENDEVIPRSSTEQLYARFKTGVATLRVLPGTSHNTVSESADYLKLLQSVL